jgi:hypothetical protein
MFFFALQRDRCQASSYEVEAMKLSLVIVGAENSSHGTSGDVTTSATKRIDRRTGAHSAA